MSARDPHRGYITWRPTKRISAKLEAVQDVLATYHDHLPMTLRQIFYVLVARLVIEKTALEYRNLAYVLHKARRARIIPFEAIHDQGSTLPRGLLGWSDASDLAWTIRDAVEIDPLCDQPCPVILWCEAAGMLTQLKRAGAPYCVDAIAGGGFDSVTDKWQIVQLVRRPAYRSKFSTSAIWTGTASPSSTCSPKISPPPMKTPATSLSAGLRSPGSRSRSTTCRPIPTIPT